MYQSPEAGVRQGRPGVLRTSGSPPGTYLEGKGHPELGLGQEACQQAGCSPELTAWGALEWVAGLPPPPNWPASQIMEEPRDGWLNM